MLLLFLLSLLTRPLSGFAIPLESPAPLGPGAPYFEAERFSRPPWHERFHLRGYSQFLFEQNDSATNGDDAPTGRHFLLRRSRVSLSGEPTKWMDILLQPDLAFTPKDSAPIRFFRIRDLYVDFYLEPKKELRLRIGKSKIPFGFENLQSGQDRLGFDPYSATRGLGAFLYWAPTEVRRRFQILVDSGLKGTEDFGLLALGAYSEPHAPHQFLPAARVTYPFRLTGGQFVEASLQATANPAFRGRASLMIYPQPFGFQAEYDLGKESGYAQVMYKYDKFIPYGRAQFFQDGPRRERQAELGVEWRAARWLELTGAYARSRQTEEIPTGSQPTGHLIRFQTQLNY